MRLLSTLAALLFVVVGLMACDAVIDDTEDPISSAGDADLDSPDEVDFLVAGIIARGNNVQDNMTIQAGLLSDQILFGGDIGGGATFPTFRDLMRGHPPGTNPLNNNSVDGTQNHLGQYRFLADNILRRVDRLGADAFEGGESDPLWEAAQFHGNFHGGLARYYWATYFGELPRSGGGIISDLDNPADPERGDFVPSDQMYQLALDKLDEALNWADDYETRLINTVKARIYLFQDDVAQAAQYAANGLEPGDAPFQNEYLDRSGNQQNAWFSGGGPGRTQVVTALRFFYGDDYLAQDLESPEAARIPVFDSNDTGEVTADGLFNRDATSPIRHDVGLEEGDEPVLYAQGLYMGRDAPIDFATWQENHLMLAEAAVRGESGEDALGLINEVRASHGLDDIEQDDFDGNEMNTIYLERDKELFTMGLRLPDQRRATIYGLDAEGLDLDLHGWHLADNTWWFLPITLDERLNNPNLPNEI